MDKIPLTTLINASLRVAYMVLSLIAIKLTFNLYSSQEFIEFNYVLFIIGISTFIYYPFTIDLWQRSDENIITGVTLSFVLSLFYLFGMSSVFFAKGYKIELWFLIGALVYGLAKYFERVSYVHRLTNKQYFSAYTFTFVVLAIEFVSLLLIMRFNCSVVLRLLLPGIVVVYAGIRFLKKKQTFSLGIALLSVKNYLNNRNILLIVYMGLLSLTIVSDRAIAYSKQGDLASILLVFSFTTSVLTLLNVIIDTFRPRIVELFNAQKSLFKLWKEASIILFLVYFTALTLGYLIVVKLSLIPDQMFAYWGSFLTINLLISLCNLFQIARQSDKEIKTINIAWGATLLVKIALYVLFKNLGLSYLSFVQSLGSVFCLTLGMNYYYECKYLQKKNGRIGEST